MRKKFALIAFVLAVWAVATWNGGWFTRWNLPFWNAASEFPLGDAKGIVVDSQGRIYCGSQYYNRIQVYDSSGRYLSGWFIRGNRGGPFRLRLNAQDQLEVASLRTDRIFTFDYQGNLIDLKEADDPYEAFGPINERVYLDRGDNRYEIRSGSAFPHIVRNGIPVVRTPWYLWLSMAPFPAWLFGVMSAIIGFILKKTMN